MVSSHEVYRLKYSCNFLITSIRATCLSRLIFLTLITLYYLVNCTNYFIFSLFLLSLPSRTKYFPQHFVSKHLQSTKINYLITSYFIKSTFANSLIFRCTVVMQNCSETKVENKFSWSAVRELICKERAAREF